MEEYLPIVGLVAAVLVAYFIARLLFRRARGRNLARLTETLNAEVSARGWSVSSEYRGELRLIHWRGASDGIQWTADSVVGWRGTELQRRRFSTTTWQTSGLRGSTGPVVLVGMAGHPEFPASLPSVEGPVADLAKTAVLRMIDEYIDQHFAPEIGGAIDAKRLQRVEGAERRLAGYVVAAANPADATRVIEQGVGRALSETAGAMPSTHTPEGFFVVICAAGVGLVRPGAVQSLGELEPIIRRGIALTNVVKW